MYDSLPKLLAYREKYGLSWTPKCLNRHRNYLESKFERLDKKTQKELQGQREIENQIEQEQKLYEAENILKIMRNGR